MLKNPKSTYLILFFLVAAIFFYEYHKFQNNMAPLDADSNGLGNAKSNSKGSRANNIPPSDSSNLISTVPAEVTKTKAFSIWFADEAKNLDTKVIDQQEKEAELKDKALRFSAEETSFLVKASTNSKATANERIEATYLLTLSSATNSLIEISKTPLSLPSPQPVHSVGETLLMQEKAIRIMAIDELFNRVKDNAALRPILLQTINQLQDESVKHYALKRLKELR